MIAKTDGSGRIRVAVSGALGRMGSTTCRAVMADPELELVATIDPAYAVGMSAAQKPEMDEHGIPSFTGLEAALANGGIDAAVDFSLPVSVKSNVSLCIGHGVPAVVGTTGLTADDLAELDTEASRQGVPVLIAPNFALGAVLMMQFAEQAANQLGACEIVELHHAAKVDAPSGTARLTQARIEQVWREMGSEAQVPVHSVRLPGLVAHQEVIFGGVGETLTIRHDSLSRESFMPGVVLALKRVGRLQGLVVGLENIL